MSETVQTLDKDKILSTQKRRLLYNELLQGKSIKEAAPLAGLGINYAQNIVAKCGMNELVKRETAEISAKTGITVENQQLALLQDIESARAAGSWGAVMSGRATLLKSIGGMTGDRPHPDSMAKNKLGVKEREFLLAVAERVYSERYLAVPGTDSSMCAQFEGETEAKAGVNEPQSEPQPATEATSEDRAENFSEAPPMPPQAPAAESPTLPLLHTEVF